MSSVIVEDGVLKLVYPGKIVKVFKQPMIAAEALSKYPRHSVTRPDVFEYPWVVINPDAVLNLGKVFFIVPNHTIYKLMKAHKKKRQNFSSQNQNYPSQNRPPPKNIVNHHQAKSQDSLQMTNAGSTPKHLIPYQQISQSPQNRSCLWISSRDQDRDLRTRKQNKVVSWPDMPKNRSTILRLEDKPINDSRLKIGPSNRDKYHSNDQSNILRLEEKPAKDPRFKVSSSTHDQYHHANDRSINRRLEEKLVKDSRFNEEYDTVSSIFPEMSDDDDYYDIELTHSRYFTPLKSCIRKPNSARKLLKLQVTFSLPSEDEEQRRSINVSRDEFSRN